MINDIKKSLLKHLEDCLPEDDFKNVLTYATLPPGKLFRPKLVWAFALDLGEVTENHKIFGSSIEIHHAYTLVHDDLPAMDNDDMRRGKSATHKHFNEFKAILAGDALLNYSFALLGKIENCDQLNTLLMLYGEYTGAKGLILGQVLDLAENNCSFDDILLIHSLKTSRLIQLALLGSNLLSNSPIAAKKLEQLGLSLGIVFQLLDDLSELSQEVSSHEKDINPFIKFDHNIVTNELKTNLEHIDTIISEYKLQHLEGVINSYLGLMAQKINSDQESIKNFVPQIDLIINTLNK